MAELERNLAEAHAREAALGRAQRDEPAKLDAFAARIEALAARVKALQPRVAELAAAQQLQVQELAVAELVKQKERLAAYVSQARFAVAQIYDRANLAKGGDGAANR
jgi:chromosome segregation ATPase